MSLDPNSAADHRAQSAAQYRRSDSCITEGETDLAFTERVASRFDAQGWHVQHVEDGTDLDDIEAAIASAQDATERPFIVCVHTHIGYGSPQQDTAAVHGSPLGAEDADATKERLGWPTDEPFHVPEAAYEHCRRAVEEGAEAESEWETRVEEYRAAHPDSCELFLSAMEGEVPEYEADQVPTFQPDDGPMATRNASGETLQALAANICTLVGGSADLAPSNKTHLEGYEDFTGGLVGRLNAVSGNSFEVESFREQSGDWYVDFPSSEGHLPGPVGEDPRTLGREALSRHKLPALMLFFAAVAALGLLAYYFLRRQDNEEPKQSGTKGTANRNRRPGRPEPKESGKSKGPQIHRRKVESEVEETIRRARARAEDLLEKGKEEKLAWEAYCLAESIRKMFSSEEFFGRGRRPGSFRTALEVAEDARDRLIDRQREAVRQKEMAGARRPSYVGDKYVKTAVESALVVAWCAGGLIGKSRHESAQEVFYVSVSAGDVRDWDRFDRILRKEREHCMAES